VCQGLQHPQQRATPQASAHTTALRCHLRRRRIFNTQCGIYTPGCGLSSVYMRWSASEYLHMVLVLNRQVVDLPDAALFMIRNHKASSLTRPGSPYTSLLNDDELALLPMLREFQEVGTRAVVLLRCSFTVMLVLLCLHASSACMVPRAGGAGWGGG
jgi:hypothetical protein